MAGGEEGDKDTLLSGFLFGNVNEKGHLVEGYFDNDIRESLTKIKSDSIVNKSILKEEGTSVPDDEEYEKKADDAVDYQDIDELADEQQFEQRSADISREMDAAGKKRKAFDFGDDDDYDRPSGDTNGASSSSSSSSSSSYPALTTTPALAASASAELPTLDQALAPPAPQEIKHYGLKEVKEFFPQFDKGKRLRFLELFYQQQKLTSASAGRRKKRPRAKPGPQDFPVDLDEEEVFTTQESFSRRGGVRIFKKREQNEDAPLPQADNLAISLQGMGKQTECHLFLLSPWEEKIVWGDSDEEMQAEKDGRGQQDTSEDEMARTYPYLDMFNQGSKFNVFIDSEWEDQIIWDDRSDDLEAVEFSAKAPPRPPIILDLNDDHMLLEHNIAEEEPAFEMLEEAPSAPTGPGRGRRKRKKVNPLEMEMEAVIKGGGDLDKFNLSNDRFYELKKPKKSERVRHGVSKLALRHSLPALRLDYPFYKTSLSRHEIRNLHRPRLTMPPGQAIPVQLTKPAKKKALRLAKKGDPIQSFRDVTLRDSTKFVLFEYSEEHPPLMMKEGMGTLIYNYYRKRDEADSYVPQLDDGIPMPLEAIDQSPFSTFGDIKPGETVPTLSNNLFRAPIFKHQPYPTDFLLIKSRNRLWIREIPTIYIVGQTFPLYQIPPPNSRTSHQFARNYIDAFVIRHFRRKDNTKHRLPLREMARIFPILPAPVIKKKLREFAEIAKRDDDRVPWWYMKEEVAQPSEEELRKRVTPEMVCAHESMLFAQQSLRDAGYNYESTSAFKARLESQSREKDDDDEDDESSMVDDELKLVPWRITKNVIQAFQGKVLLQISGFGDPTGRGEGYSFVRVPMRVFHPRGEPREAPPPVQRTPSLAGTDSDLRKMSIDAAKKFLLSLGVTEAEMAGQGRWQLISEVRRLSAAAGEQGSRYVRQSKSSTAEQMRSNKQDALRIWNAQRASLTVQAVAESDDSDLEEPDFEKSFLSELQGAVKAAEPARAETPKPEKLTERGDKKKEKGPEDDGGSVFSVDSKAGKAQKILRIERKVRVGDSYEWKYEDVSDPRVIDMYLRERKEIEEDNKNIVIPTDSENMKREKRRIEEQLRRLQQAQQKQLLAAKHGPPQPGISRKSKLSPGAQLTIRCGACGAVGHMKTNRMCPRFSDKDATAPDVVEEVEEAGEGGGEEEEEEEANEGLKELGDQINIDPEARKIKISHKAIEKVHERQKNMLTVKIKPPPAPVKQRKESQTFGLDDFVADYSNPTLVTKSNTRIRKSPEPELNAILEEIVNSLKNIPESLHFHTSVRRDHFRDSIDLNKIREKTRKQGYRSGDEFLGDVQLMADYSKLHNGAEHVITQKGLELVEIARRFLQEKHETISNLEKLIRGERAEEEEHPEDKQGK